MRNISIIIDVAMAEGAKYYAYWKGSNSNITCLLEGEQ